MRMKNLFLSAVLLLFAIGLNAQSVESQYPGDAKAQEVYQTAFDKQAASSALRTTWLANRPCDNWFLSLSGGASLYVGEGFKDELDAGKLGDAIAYPVIGLSVGKWYSPVWGLRGDIDLGRAKAYERGTGFDWRVGKVWRPTGVGNYLDSEGLHEFSWATATLDGMLNLKNFFMPYNPKGFFNPVFYLGLGWGHTFGQSFDPWGIANKDGSKRRSIDAIVLKSGLQLNFRLGDPVNLFLDIQGIAAPDIFDACAGGQFLDLIGNASLGLTYNFNFRKFIKAPLFDQDVLDALNKEINDLRNRPEKVCPAVPVCPPAPECPKVTNTGAVEQAAVELTPVFFTIDSSVVRDNQMVNVASAAEYLISHPDAKIELRSYADIKTGNPKYNQALSERRSAAVAKVLVDKFGIAKNRITQKAFGDKVQPYADNDQNRVTLFIK